MPKLTKIERALVKIHVAMMSFQRFTEREMVTELAKRDPPINLGKTAIHDILVGLEKQSEKWYIQLRDSRYKYIATYKDRIDSLFRYQNMVHNAIITGEIEKLAGIKELHQLELSIKDIYKEIPEIGNSVIQDVPTEIEQQQEQQVQPTPEWS